VVVRGSWLLIGNAQNDQNPSYKGDIEVYKLINSEFSLQRRIYDFQNQGGSVQFPSGLASDGVNMIIGEYGYRNRLGHVYFASVDN
jgi:hypothetical protein